jgi:hypothetical protein
MNPMIFGGETIWHFPTKKKEVKNKENLLNFSWTMKFKIMTI